MEETKIIVYGTEWCWDCRRSRRFFDDQKIPYQWINIDKDSQAEGEVIKINGGNRSVPTIIFPDGTILVEPSNSQLKDKLQLA